MDIKEQDIPDADPVMSIMSVNWVQDPTLTVMAVDCRFDTSFKVELDSHADTCCAGGDVMVVNDTHRLVTVTPFLKSLGTAHKVPIISAAIAYDDPKSGCVFILIIHQVLHFKEMNHCLLSLMQFPLNDIVVNEQPKFLTQTPTEKHHAIVADDLLIPLELSGVTSYFPARRPTMKEYSSCNRIEMTAPEPEWKPHDVRYSEEESSYMLEDGSLRAHVRSVFELQSHNEERFISAIRCSVIVEYDSVAVDDLDRVLSSLTSNAVAMAAEKLSRTWGIGLTNAKKTIEVTTQKAVHTVAYPSVERRWPTGDHPLRYKRLSHKVFHDTMKANVVSSRGNKCSEMYATDFGWSRSFPMTKESDVHETLDLFLSRYGIPEALVSDGAQAYLGGQFKKKAKEAGCFCKVTDPYSPWQNHAEGEIREVKRLAGRWMLKARSPRRLWDHCLELASLVRSHTAHEMYQLQIGRASCRERV